MRFPHHCNSSALYYAWTHSTVLAWRIPGTEEPGGLPSMGSHSQTRLTWLSSSSIMPDVSEALNFFLEWRYELDFPYVFILTDGPLKMLNSRPLQSKPLLYKRVTWDPKCYRIGLQRQRWKATGRPTWDSGLLTCSLICSTTDFTHVNKYCVFPTF